MQSYYYFCKNATFFLDKNPPFAFLYHYICIYAIYMYRKHLSNSNEFNLENEG